MPGPLAAAGAISNPTRYAALNMAGEQFTGLWTQRSPYRDAATAYLIKKFYQGSRFDSIWDGLNREITSKLTDGRRPGSTLFNANSVPPVNSFYSWKYIQNGIERVRVIADHTDGIIRDVTPGAVRNLFTKSTGAGPARFLGVTAELFFGDGIDLQKILGASKTWQANTPYNAGDRIIDAAGNVQVALGAAAANIATIQVVSSTLGLPPTLKYFLKVTFATNVNWAQGTNVTFAGVTTYPAINNKTLAVYVNNTYLTPAANVAYFGAVIRTAYGPAADTGMGTPQLAAGGTAGVSGGTQPIWPVGYGSVTIDNTVTWIGYLGPVYNWQIAPPTQSAYVVPGAGNRFWQPAIQLSQWYSILDANGNIEVATAASPEITGIIYPTWSTSAPLSPSGSGQTVDGAVAWQNCGPILGWTASTVYKAFQCVLDSNQNLQIVTAGGGGSSGGSAPAWASTIGTTTTDGALTWTCVGPGTQLLSGVRQYSYAYHSIDGGLTTIAPLIPLNPSGPMLGPSGGILGQLVGNNTADPQCDQIWLFATAQNQSTPILLAQIPNPQIGTLAQWSYNDSIPDTSLNPFTIGPQASAGNPPPAGLTGPVLHLQRVWGFAGNVVYYSGGPDTITGNGYTAWPPLNQISYQGQVVKLVPITVQNGGLLVFTTSGIFIILGLGTASNPFYSTQYCTKINLAGYNALDVFGTEIFLMEANAKVSSLVIEYPFNPQSGYAEVGFPIGDQFKKVTTGGFSSTLFNPANCYLSWNVQGTTETAMYVADGAGHWFRLSMVSPPETGMMWSPIASLAGGSSAVQSIETAPGVFDLLIGPPPPGPGGIYRRDTTGAVWQDGAPGGPTSFSSWDAKGVNLLCSTGQWTEVAHISAKSAAVGARPVVSVLLGEIAPSTSRPWNVLDVTSPDPPDTPRSMSVYSDRYSLAQNGIADTGDCILTKFDYGAQAFGDELLDWGIYASTEDERKEVAEK